MSEQTSEAEKAYYEWIKTNRASGLGRDLTVWRAAWAAKEVEDLAHVEAERLEHNPMLCDKPDTCGDCAYHRALNDVARGIRGQNV